ncbi:ALI_HP2_G0039180.mRNA.1.CDS.1 [Saccharomyces cerevisiae]|nr:ALI_HP2_G0039180.mRNA.1.CDS.1 [Saccharomyces cerevisiae]CAI6607940.1 ALI_HP2_G0039180.mRNA.1.CDS.1 [Saccharomyces cerevisiae]CAI6697851.1 ALI_HP1_G0041030.mRNA.1.CDS.1 [Saccharomyces cerevisiae]
MVKVWNIVLRLVVLLFLAGNTLLLILMIISGATDHYPVNRFYWVRGNTTGIPNAGDETRWTFWGACLQDKDGSDTCTSNLAPAYPISPVDNFNTHINVPHQFISKRDAFYYLTRFSFCFFWIALAFVGVSFILYVLTWCSKMLSEMVLILMSFGFVFNTAAVVLQTAASAMAKNAFHDDHRSAQLGASMMGMAWASVFLCIVEFILLVFWSVRARLASTYSIDNSRYRTSSRWNPFHREKEQATDPILTATGPEDMQQSASIVGPSSNANPVTATAATENQPKGINFFTIRKSHERPDDVSV